MKTVQSVDSIEKVSLRNLVKRAEAGDAAAQGLLGRKLHHGIGVSKNIEKAFHWAKLAEKQGDYRGQALLGYYYLNGIIVEKDYKKSLELYMLSAEQKYSPAIHTVGLIYYRGYGVERDFDTAKFWFQRAIKAGDIYSFAFLGFICEKENEPYKAIRYYKKGAERGCSVAQAFLSYKYRYGQKVRENFVLAMHWAQVAAKEGNAIGQFVLGEYYTDGIGHPPDCRLGHKWLLRSAKSRYVPAMNKLGDNYLLGKGVKKNFPRAEYWFLCAAEAGSEVAQFALGHLYEEKNDFERAHYWYLRAAEKGHPGAQFFLFDGYMTGALLDGEPDVEEAYRWLDQAFEGGSPNAIKTKTKMEEFLFTTEGFNDWAGIPSQWKLPVRRRTFWLIDLLEIPLYDELLDDLRRYIAAYPIIGFEFMEAIPWLEQKIYHGDKTQNVYRENINLSAPIFQ